MTKPGSTPDYHPEILEGRRRGGVNREGKEGKKGDGVGRSHE